jgi:hypothetical protein
MANDFTTQEVTYSDETTSTLTFTWSVTGLKTKREGSFENAVVQTHWKLKATDSDGHEGEFSGATPFSTVGMTGDFTQFSDLQEETVLGWIQAEVAKNEQYQDHIFESIFRQMDHKKTDFKDVTMPWAPVDAPRNPDMPATEPAPLG